MQSSLFPGVTGPVLVDSQGERCMDYSVCALQKSGNGPLFLPVLHYHSFQKVIRYWWDISSSLAHAIGRDLGGVGGLGVLLGGSFGIHPTLSGTL